MGTGTLSSIRAAGLSGDDVVRSLHRARRAVTGFGDVEVEDADNGLSVGRNGDPPTVTVLGIAIVAEKGPAGEDQPTNASYWLAWHRFKPGAGIRVPDSKPSGAEYDDRVFAATNWAETNDTTDDEGTHLLPAGTRVTVLAVQDENGSDRLVFDKTPGTARLKVTSAGTRAGCYYDGFAIGRPPDAFDTTVDLVGGVLDAPGTACVIVNPQELGLGANSHLITTSGTAQVYYHGIYVGVTTDDPPLPVYEIVGAPVAYCAPTETP